MNSAEWTSFKPPLNQTKNTTENKTKHLLNKHFLYSFYTHEILKILKVLLLLNFLKSALNYFLCKTHKLCCFNDFIEILYF